MSQVENKDIFIFKARFAWLGFATTLTRLGLVGERVSDWGFKEEECVYESVGKFCLKWIA